MANASFSAKKGDVYAQMAPQAEDEPGFWQLRKEGLSTTRAARRSFRYLGLRLSALLYGVGGTLGVWLLGRHLGADLAWLGALPLPGYAALALGVPTMLELIRQRELAKPSRSARLLRFLGRVLLVGAVIGMIAQPEAFGKSGWLVILLLYLIPEFLAGLMRGKPKPDVAGTSQNANAPKPPEGRLGKSAGTAAPQNAQLAPLVTRAVGLADGVFWLLVVGVFPAFLARLFIWPRVHFMQGFGTVTLALVFVALGAAILGAVGALAEKVAPRFPRLIAFLIVFGPFGVSLAIPGFPNLVSAAIGASHILASQATRGWGLL